MHEIAQQMAWGEWDAYVNVRVIFCARVTAAKEQFSWQYLEIKGCKVHHLEQRAKIQQRVERIRTIAVG